MRFRRLFLVFILLLPTGTGNTLAQSLREQADKRKLLIGAAVNPGRFSEAPYAETLAREFNMVEAENVMKWGGIRPAQDKFNFGPGDQVVAFAVAHKMKVRGHCLLWSEYNPAWLAKGSFTPEQLSKLLEEHITTVMKHYSGKVFAWDVVNESFLANGKIEPSIWYDSPGIGLAEKGTAYVEQAFRWARAADPKALLFYNDYDTEGLNPKSDAVYEMAKDFKKRGVPIDGVGIQAHIIDLDMAGISSLAANMKRLTALGLQVHITEMDVGLRLEKTGALMDQADLDRQAEIYRFVATVCVQEPGCAAFMTWGFTDKYSWIPGYTKGAKGKALLFDQAYAPKPAYRALREVLAR
ncbi:MAG: endo-1,4-beta-xylanase [Pyrinomonadaceae bacterium]|nr:endo-1,4-beta-xylanase [Pyrinomonadaceae bacterium]